MDAKSGIEAISVNIAAVRSTIPQYELPEFEAGLAKLRIVSEAVGHLASTEALNTWLDPVTRESDIVEVDMTPEQQERVSKIQSAFAEHFSTDERKLTTEDFGVFSAGDADDRKLVVTLTAINGLCHGSWHNVMDKNIKNAANYIVEIDGQKIDTREGMTWEVYQAFINNAKAVNVATLPDSDILQGEDDVSWTATWLTGDVSNGFSERYGDVHEGEPRRVWYDRRSDWSRVRFRPAAVV